MRTANPEKIAKQRQEIVLAAIRTFNRVGLAASSTDDICREAGISAGRLYYYFKSKDELIHEVIHHVHNSTFPSSSRLLLQTEDVVDGLVRGYEAAESYLADITLSNRLVLEIISSSNRHPKLSHFLRMEHEAALKHIQDALRRQQQAGTLRPDADTASLAELFLIVLRGTRVSTLFTDKSKDPRLRQFLETIILPYRASPNVVRKRRRRT